MNLQNLLVAARAIDTAAKSTQQHIGDAVRQLQRALNEPSPPGPLSLEYLVNSCVHSGAITEGCGMQWLGLDRLQFREQYNQWVQSENP